MTWTAGSRSSVRFVLAIATALALALAGLVAAPAADAAEAAAKKPKISWSYTPSIVRPGATVTVRYSVKKAPKKGKVILQRKKGKKWTKVKSLKRGSRTTTFKAHKKGTRTYRIVVRSKKGKVLRASKKKIKVTPLVPQITSMSLSATRVSENEQITLRYGVVSVPGGASVKLQRAMGTVQQWTDVQTLATTPAGEVQITAPSMGAHPYRIVVKNKKGAVLATSSAVSLYSYKDIPWADLRSRSTNTIDVGGRLFRYTYRNGFSGGTFLSFDKTSCRSVTFEGAIVDSRSLTGTVSAVQETADLQSFNLVTNQVSSATFTLSGDAVQFDHTYPGYQSVYLNGVFSCYTLDGER